MDLSGSMDLLSFGGASTRIEINGKADKVPNICIPQNLNGVDFVQSNYNGKQKQQAFVKILVRPLSERYKESIRKANRERGDFDKDVPTHELVLTYSKEYVIAVAKAYPKLVEQVKEAGKATDPDIVNQNFEDTTTHLFKAIRNRMQKRLCNLYMKKEANQQPYPQQAYTAAGNATAYVPPADGANDYSSLPGYNDPNSDLPF